MRCDCGHPACCDHTWTLGRVRIVWMRASLRETGIMAEWRGYASDGMHYRFDPVLAIGLYWRYVLVYLNMGERA